MQTEPYQVRSCKPEEVSRLVELLKATKLFWDIGDTEEVFRKQLAYDADSIIVLEHEGEIIGMAMIYYTPHASFIFHVAVDPRHQGKGLGHLLAEEAENRLWKRGTTCVSGYIVPDNAQSRSFFRRRGYNEAFASLIGIEKLHTKGGKPCPSWAVD